jgi:hypothetical protein
METIDLFITFMTATTYKYGLFIILLSIICVMLGTLFFFSLQALEGGFAATIIWTIIYCPVWIWSAIFSSNPSESIATAVSSSETSWWVKLTTIPELQVFTNTAESTSWAWWIYVLIGLGVIIVLAVIGSFSDNGSSHSSRSQHSIFHPPSTNVISSRVKNGKLIIG